jgi:hypothetical protein
MDPSVAYDLALFLHVVGVLGLFAALTVEGIVLRGIRESVTGDQARTWLGLLRPQRIVGPAALLLILLPGLYLAATIDTGGGWIGAGLVGFVAIGILGGAVTGRRMAVVGPTLGRAQGPLDGPATQASHDAALTTSFAIRFAVALGIVWLMTVKPDFVPSLVVLGGAAILGSIAGRTASDSATAQPIPAESGADRSSDGPNGGAR